VRSRLEGVGFTAAYAGTVCKTEARRGEALGTSEARQTLEYAIETGRGGIYLRLTPEQYGKMGRPPRRKQYAQRAITPKGDVRMSKYRFIFSVGDKPDLQGYVDFPEGEVPHFPQTNNEVNCASNYGQEIKGVVQDISFH
jgi:hypothetical protein